MGLANYPLLLIFFASLDSRQAKSVIASACAIAARAGRMFQHRKVSILGLLALLIGFTFVCGAVLRRISTPSGKTCNMASRTDSTTRSNRR